MNLKNGIFDIADFRDALSEHEGRRNKKYQDHKGVWTIGVGFNIDVDMPSKVVHALVEDGLTEEQIDRMLDVHIEEHWHDLIEAKPIVAELPGPVQEAFLNMAFQLGVPRLKKFINMWSGVEEGDWQRVVDEAKDSNWFRNDTQESRLDYVISRLETMLGPARNIV